MMNPLQHPLDLVTLDDDVELVAEELPAGVERLSDCLATASSFSTDGTFASIACLSSIWSCG
jgi:hypothetical protein